MKTYQVLLTDTAKGDLRDITFYGVELLLRYDVRNHLSCLLITQKYKI